MNYLTKSKKVVNFVHHSSQADKNTINQQVFSDDYA